MLEFIAAHRFVQFDHVREWIGAGRSVAYNRLWLLEGAGLIRHERIFHAQPGIYHVTSGGLAVIDSSLQRPTVDLRLYRHEAAVPAIWLAAREGAFGPAAEIWTERQIVHHDLALVNEDDVPLGVALGGYDRAGRARLHSPDVQVVPAGSGRTAIELELSLKGRRRLDEIILAYERDSSVRRVVYITDQRNIAHAVKRSASLLAPDKVKILTVSLPLTTTAVLEAASAAGVGKERS